MSGKRKGPPPEDVTRRAEEGRTAEGRDVTPAVGRRGQAGGWVRTGEKVALAKERWGDARWSFLYDKDTRYASASANGSVAEAARRARGGGEVPVAVQGPMIHATLWTWEVPVYFFVGGLAAGSSLVSVACDQFGDHEGAELARKLALGAVLPAPLLLIADLGRPARFLNMLRIFKVRSPMSMGAWCLVAFSTTATGAVAADVLGFKRAGRAAGVATALLGSYLGSYTGALLAATATPLWARSRVLLAPIFVCTAAASGAGANRLLQRSGPTREALGHLELLAMGGKLILSPINDRHIGSLAEPLEHHRAYKLSNWAARIGVALRLLRRGGDVPSVLFLASALLTRIAWIEAGKQSAGDDEAVARMARR
ncbi:polysulfide reductase NrfD [Solirubrobacter sp. CPCC 204708]|uniref:Polysulfide reductase NrfD n=1 Tax=Solirubrobacter deserti TaxID=2282478 RepID=A0ABT4RD56_9ACTN|nr:NrfD/PsrC family molybdoenzyme membrane anchor subunit [Solirubrobacter deserti]MBE2317765.1 polysulfide reductase NrfD [Solirubrobacter deserti]MDA0136458.1 polysulfide reductase NrfD [Solirubrobacter deserti]